MNPRLAKEFRQLLFPWCVCALAGFGHLAGRVADGAVRGAFTGLAAFAFYLGCLLLATLPLGSEFQQRTLPLLLGQPIERSRLWMEKFLAATLAVLALVAVHGIMVAIAGQTIQPDDVLPCVGFVIATICSAALFTLASRSIIGGMVFAGSMQFFIFGMVSGVIYLTYRILGRDPVDPDMDKWPIITAYVCAGAVFSTLTLWLGWRTFAEMEVRDATPSTDLRLPDRFTPKTLATLFRCQPGGALGNLIRKEVGLQKPVFTIAVVFIACWIVALLLLLLEPSRRDIYVGALNVLTAVHIIIVTLLGGCISLSDEKLLGLAAWHLTLPISIRRQWLIKLLVSAATVLLVGFVLPLFLSCLTLAKAKVGLVAMDKGDNSGFGIVLVIMWVVGVLGFWCASFWENTMRSALSTIVSLIVIGTVVQLGAWAAFEYSPGLQTNLVPDIATHEAILPYAIGLVILVGTFVALLQSLAQFRYACSPPAIMFKSSLVLATVIFAGSFWCMDLVTSIGTLLRSR